MNDKKHILWVDDEVNLLRSHALNKLPPEREKQGAWKYDVVDLGYLNDRDTDLHKKFYN